MVPNEGKVIIRIMKVFMDLLNNACWNEQFIQLVRSVIGEPTGTSIKFCDQMVCGVREYFRKMHNLEIPMDVVTTIPLEGEGKVEERVEKLYNILKDKTEWMEALTSADVIFWATHSQGTPVSAILLHRLIAKNHIDPASQALCLLAMAGIAHGPFPSLKGSLIVKVNIKKATPKTICVCERD